MMGISDTCQLMEEGRIAVDRLKMGDVVFLDPYGIHLLDAVVGKGEQQYILRMGIADGQRETGTADETVQQQRIRSVIPL